MGGGRLGGDGVEASDVKGFEAFGAGFGFELDGFAFFEGAEAFGGDGGVVDEDVLAAFATDEAESLLIVEPFDFAGANAHEYLPICLRLAEVSPDEAAAANRSPWVRQDMEPTSLSGFRVAVGSTGQYALPLSECQYNSMLFYVDFCPQLIRVCDIMIASGRRGEGPA